MLRLIVAVMALFALASGAFANSEIEVQCFAPEVDTCAAAPTSGDVLMLAQQADCRNTYNSCAANCTAVYQGCMASGESIWCEENNEECIAKCTVVHCPLGNS